MSSRRTCTVSIYAVLSCIIFWYVIVRCIVLYMYYLIYVISCICVYAVVDNNLGLPMFKHSGINVNVCYFVHGQYNAF